MKRLLYSLLVVLATTFLAIFSVTGVMSAQTVSGELTGTVYDSTGASVPNATVVATNTETGVQANTATSGTGQYRLRNLAAGKYDVRVTSPGFSMAELKALEVNLNVTATANITLQIGESKTIVEVSGSAVTIDTTTAQVQTIFNAKDLVTFRRRAPVPAF